MLDALFSFAENDGNDDDDDDKEQEMDDDDGRMKMAGAWSAPRPATPRTAASTSASWSGA